MANTSCSRDLMCDTVVALGSATARGGVLFAKNSDRERNEAQRLEQVPRREARSDRRAKLTYIEVDDDGPSHACLISRPFWMWGAEMGVNEHGVTIGNEAMHAIIPAARRRALTGMDLVRLGLERGGSAAEAVEIMTVLLERHGQGGDCGHRSRFYYNNGFIVADPREAFVLETVGREWIVERARAVRTLSNALSIGDGPDRVSAALRGRAQAEGWTDGDGRFHFADRMIDQERDLGTFGRGRCARAAALLAPKLGRITTSDLMAVLRDHGVEAEGDPGWSPRTTVGRTICMHAAQGARRSQTVASLVADLSGPSPILWVTGTAAPCLSLFKPARVGTPLPNHGAPPTDQYDSTSLWWRHERLHRGALASFPETLAALVEVRDRVEESFRVRIREAQPRSEAELDRAIQACWSEAADIEEGWSRAVQGGPASRPNAMGRSAATSWARLNAIAGVPTSEKA